MMPSSIKFKFFVAMLVTTLVALVVSAGAMVTYNLNDYKTTVTDELVTQARLLARVVTPALEFNDPDSAQTYLSLLENQPKILAAAIYNERGTLVAGYNPGGDSPEFLTLAPSTDGTRVDGNSLIYYDRIIANNEIIGIVFVRMEYSLYDKLQGNLAIAIAGIFLALIIALLVSIRLQRSITGPLRSLAGVARKLVETKDYSLRAEKATEGELGYLVDAWNEMLDEVEQHQQALEISNQELAGEIHERRATEASLKKSEEQILELNAELEQRVRERTLQLEVANKELEAFSYSVSHDLRSPLRAIDGFSQALLEDYQDKLDDEGKDYLTRTRNAAQRMGELIDDMLKLSRVSRAEMNLQNIDLSKLAEQLFADIRDSDPQRQISFKTTSGLHGDCDPHLIKIALTNLLHNAWKYSSKNPQAQIEFGMRQQQGKPAFFVQDNGAGFDMTYAKKLFGAFQRLHSADEFPGSGIGLATVKRVINRHGGKVWAEASPGKGAVFYFTLPGVEKAKVINLHQSQHEHPAHLQRLT